MTFGFDWPSGFRGEDVSILWKYTCTKGGPVNRGLCLLYENYSMHRPPIYKYILRTRVLGTHTKFQKNTPKNKISVHNTKLQVMQTWRTLTTSSTVMRQLHVLHVLTVYSL